MVKTLIKITIQGVGSADFESSIRKIVLGFRDSLKSSTLMMVEDCELDRLESIIFGHDGGLGLIDGDFCRFGDVIPENIVEFLEVWQKIVGWARMNSIGIELESKR